MPSMDEFAPSSTRHGADDSYVFFWKSIFGADSGAAIIRTGTVTVRCGATYVPSQKIMSAESGAAAAI